MVYIKYLLLIATIQIILPKAKSDKLVVISVATEKTDGFKRFERSLKAFDYEYEIYGLNQEWKGGDVKNTAGGGQKVNILKKELEKYKDDESTILIFTDSYDVIANDEPKQALNKFKSSGARVLFSAEAFCWPNESLKDDYPKVGENEKRFLNSGMFMGYASDIYQIVTMNPIKDEDDDQLYYTKIFLNSQTREKIKIKLDTKSDIFQNLNGALSEIALVSMNNDLVIYNNKTEKLPAFVHGNGPVKLIMNRLGNYIGKVYSLADGCKVCNEDKLILDENVDKWPDVTIGIFIEQASPFLREFFEKISNLSYPKSKINILIHNNVKYHNPVVEAFFNHPKNEYNAIKYISPDEDSLEHEARAEAIEECKRTKCDYYFSLDSTAHLDNKETLKLLIEQNRDIIAPIMIRKETTWSNIWGAVNEKGYYLRSEDYLDIIYRSSLGVWVLPHISEAILIKKDLLQKVEISFEDAYLDPSLKFSQSLRDKDIFMYGTNMVEFGHLINPDSFNTSLIRPEMYEIFTNYEDWVVRYVHENYTKYLNDELKPEQPCPDVYWFPVVTDEYCDDLITMTEHFGKWSGGRDNNYDSRLPGGYENVPTVDIHMRQLDWEKHYLFFLKKIMLPIQQKIFIGYYHDPPESLLNFVVRYRPGEQDSLKPHHDASTYTLNMALNRPQIDFQGGGVKFLRYNCSVLDTRKGWTFIHPGRLTHYHEGLKVTGGTRYILVSFVDP